MLLSPLLPKLRLTPTPPPSIPGMYGPRVLSKPSVNRRSLMMTSWHEHSAQRTAPMAPPPERRSRPPVYPPRSIGGPPPTHDTPPGFTRMDGTHVPPLQPMPAAHAWPHEPQFALSVAVSTHERLHTRS